MFIPIRGTVTGYMLTKHFGIPLARYMEGSVIVRQKYGVTRFHALKRVTRNR